MVTLVVLLDYTAAFDTVDHEIALTILESKFGITASSLSWFESYLSDRTFSVLSSEQQSMRVRLSCSFPQGSTLGPLLYVTYAAELQTVAERHGVRFHGFADDTQLSISVNQEDAKRAK